MALTESTKIDKIEVVNDWSIQVRQATIVERDGQFLARTFHRWVLTPDMDISDQEKKVQDICNAVWTPQLKSEYEAFKVKQAKEIP